MHRLKHFVAAGLYSTVFVVIYLRYLNPTLDYAHYSLLPRHWSLVCLTVLVTTVPVLLFGRLRELSHFVAILIYIVCYVPTMHMLLLALDRSLMEVFAIQGCFTIGMAMLILSGRIPAGRFSPHGQPRLPLQYCHVLTLLFTGAVLYTYVGHMRLVSFSDVYELRFANTEIPVNLVVGYIVMWLSSCLYPLYLAMGLCGGSKTYFIGGCIGQLIIYMATAAKSAILSPLIVLVFYYLVRDGVRTFLFRALMGLSVASLVLLFVLPGGNVLVYWTRAIVFARMLGTGGWANYIYYDYFTGHEYTYYSHLNIVNYFTASYPYGALGLGQVIGIEYAGSELANFNAGFWATDGIAACGAPGIIISSGIVSCYLIFLNRISWRYDVRFLAVWFAVFSLTLLNISFFTSLLSGGGILMALLLMFVRLDGGFRSRAPWRVGGRRLASCGTVKTSTA